MSRRKQPEEEPADARQRLLEAGLELFARRSFDGVGTRELARLAGVNIAAIAYYYGSKEGLYQAVVGHIAESLKARLMGVVTSTRRATAGSDEAGLTAEVAFALLTDFVGRFLRLFLLEPEPKLWSQIVLREQLEPSAAFDVLYKGFMREAHETLTLLVARITGSDPGDATCILRAHSVLGQMVFMSAGREVVFRRTGWTAFDATHVDTISRVLTTHLRGQLGHSPEADASRP